MARQLEQPAPVASAERQEFPSTSEAGEVDARYLNRELSRLDFVGRVLAMAEDSDEPPLERTKFLAIVGENLDEFFQVRLAGLKDQVAAGLGSRSPDGLTPAEQLRLARGLASELIDRQAAAFMKGVAPQLAEVGIRLSDWHELDADDRAHLEAVFDERIFPVLTPLAVDPSHPFPHISNLSLNLAVMVVDPEGGRRFARVKVPPLLPRFVVLPDGERFVPLEQVIAAHLELLFPGMEIESHFPFRVIRNADLALEEDEADDLLAAVEFELRRLRSGRAVRLEVDKTMSGEVLDLLVRELDIDVEDVHAIDGPLDLSGLWAVYELDRPELKDDAWVPVTQTVLLGNDDEPADILSVVRDEDVLIHHPYDSFTTSVEAFIKQAAVDPDVLAIKQTLYRTSGDSPIVKSLIRAAERGKQVAVLVEVKARFDEQANIGWARALERAGVHVVYGLVGLKTHAKIALVVRQEDDSIRRYCHIGTGNYNPKTARIYEDLGLLTTDPKLGADLTDLFNYLTGYSRRTEYRKIIVAPSGLRDRMIELIDEEARAGDGRIVMKMNGLADPAVIDALYDASQRGADIDLIVRGICCLRPGVPGLSEGIRVRSIVGRFLEHSRVFAFGDGTTRPVQYLVGSADLMPRNLDRRVEVVTPVTVPALQERLQQIIDASLADDTHAWSLNADGSWTKPHAARGVSATELLETSALQRGQRWIDIDDDSGGS
jgi:polyphosphate kinase